MSNTQSSGIQIWYWPRHCQSIPPEILWGNSLTPKSSWGTPAANFPMISGYCDYTEYFNAQQIIFDLTFCVSILVHFFFLPEPENDRYTTFLLRVILLASLGTSPAVHLCPRTAQPVSKFVLSVDI